MIFGNLARSGSRAVCNLRAAALRRIVRYQEDESGSLIVFGLFCFVIMLLLSGFALDVMRNEERRTILQSTADRAALAAADLRQTLAPADVVKDYFTKAGLHAPADNAITVNQGNFNEWRTVSVNSSEEVPTWFMKMVGVPKLGANSQSTAEERIGQVEISLVLDVSGSMNQNNRLVNLKPAAREFIDTMFETVEEGKLSISIIPYSTQVSLGPDFIKYFRNGQEQTRSSCLEFTSAEFAETAVWPKSTSFASAPAASDHLYRRNGHFDPFYTTDDIEGSGLWNCPPDASTVQNRNNNRYITAYSGNATVLKQNISNLEAEGNTSIDLGVKWGAALLDPAMQPVVSSLIARNKAPAEFASRPYSYTNTEVLKVIVLMTDGANTTQYKLKNGYTTGLSPVWRNTTSRNLSGTQRYSYYDSSRSGTKKYYSLYTGSWIDHPWGQVASDYTADNSDSAVQMTWPQVWEAMSLNYFANNIMGTIYGRTVRDQWRTSASDPTNSQAVESDTMDDNALASCAAAKARGVKIFTIGFEAATAGKALLKSCATSPAHYYSVAGLDINAAFSSIASSITKLRLTH